ncbi:MAG: hypothetical protein ACM359_04640 [Bacillota bacterium]
MTSLYNEAARMLMNRSGEETSRHGESRPAGRNVVDTILKEMQENGFPSLDRAAAHDDSCHD